MADHRPPPPVAAASAAAIASTDPTLRLFIDSVKDYAIFMLDPTGHVASWNAGAERLKGYRPNEIIGSHFSRFYPQDDIDARKPHRELEVAEELGRLEDEGWRVRKDGSLFWAHVVITAVRDADRTLVGFGKVTRDMTAFRQQLDRNERLASEIRDHARHLQEEVRRRTAELESSNAELEHANAALQTFAHSIAHDLRGPLRSVQGFAEILVEDHSRELSDEGRDYLARVAAGARRLGELVQNLLTYARLARSRTMSSLESVSWDRVIDATVRELQTELRAAGGSVNVRGPLGHVIGHRETLSIVAHNLLSNALKFVAPSTAPKIEIWVERRGDRATLNVRDNGIGVPREEQARIFTPFERLHASAVYAGTGLGLAIVAEGVQRLGGRVGVSSDGATGSCFWVDLAYAPAPGGGSGSTDPAR